MPTLPNNQITQLSNAITKELRERLLMALPDYLRLVVSEAIVNHFEKNNLRIDSKK